ncbi:protein phosphatase CheZ [Telmatospirillum sp. J64-1]|uniref:protein phosphatase CheZ n=1 Tax=Telmatospirillum sp. J64-1 TaxID=2502183 RepID=UPI00115DFFA5|nr:protein phosphatase CheZ [Telmatospirillum sp. J64-1]
MTTGTEKKLFTAEIQRMRMKNAPAASVSLGLPAGMTEGGTAEILAAIGSLKGDIARLERMLAPEPEIPAEEAQQSEADSLLESKKAEVQLLRTELRALAVCIQQTKQEIAALRPSYSDDDRLMAVTFELDAIVTATERATQNILDASERIDNLSHNIRSQAQDSHTQQLAEEIVEHVVTIFEACNFQDITGQRITKVVNTLKYIEDRVNAMVEIWGADGFLDLPQAVEDKPEDDDSKLLNGPQLENKGISQDEIDKLFG